VVPGTRQEPAARAGPIEATVDPPADAGAVVAANAISTPARGIHATRRDLAVTLIASPRSSDG
jgi:hypothetical protein